MTYRAFTLVETVITVALTTIIMLALANLYINFNSLYVYQQTFVATANAASNALSAIDAAVLPSDSVVASHTFTGMTLSTATTTLVLEVPSFTSTGEIISGAHDYIGFYLTGTDLYRQVAPDTGSARPAGTKRVAALVDSLEFSYDTADVTQADRISIRITTKLNTKNGPVQTSLERQVYLRNK